MRYSCLVMIFLGKTKNHCEIFFDQEQSHAATHFADSPKLYSAVLKTIPTINISDDKVRIEVDTGEEVGLSDLVETEDGDEIIYALRPFRNVYSRFVKDKVAIPTSFIVLAFNSSGEKKYLLHTAFVGRLTPSFPGGDYLPEQSKIFWSKHALVWGNQEVVPGTVTSVCPW